MSMATVFVLALAAGSGPALAPEPLLAQAARAEAQEGASSREDELYEKGTEALDGRAWDEAAAAFRSVADMKGRRADAGLYWLAYARSRQGRGADALAVVDELRRAYPQSRWIREAKALELEIRQKSGHPTNPDTVADEDLKLMALDGLLNTDPEQAIPLLEKFLKGSQSGKLQDRALFVLCQSDSPRAREIVHRIARGESNPELQARAIQNLGIFGGPESRQELLKIYASSSDREVRKAVLQSYMVSGEKDRLLEAARAEKDPELRAHAIQLLGAVGAKDELWAMYQAEGSREGKRALLQSLGVAGATERLLEAARTEKDMEVRLDAIRVLGPFAGPDNTSAIVEIYKGGSDPRVREAAMQALFVQGNAKALIEIARTEKDPQLRKQAVAHLSVMGSKEATAFLVEILEK
jgi:HEAT repeat protein